MHATEEVFKERAGEVGEEAKKRGRGAADYVKDSVKSAFESVKRATDPHMQAAKERRAEEETATEALRRDVPRDLNLEEPALD